MGATLYAALTGVTPEDGLAQTMGQAELTPIRDRNPKVSRQGASAVEKALAIYSEDRFQSATEFKNELLKAQGKGLAKQKSIFSSRKEPEDSEAAYERSQFSEDEVIGGIPASSSVPFSFGGDEEGDSNQEGDGRGCWGTFLRLFGVLVLLGVAIVYLLDPSLPARLLGLIGALPEATPVPEPGATLAATEEDVPLMASPTTTRLPTATFTLTPSPTVTPTITPSPTLTATPTLTHTPTRTPTPTITPRGGGKGQIAFVSLRSETPQIWITNTEGDDPTMITNMEDGACQPSWSPDGEKLVFISPCEENSRHYSDTHLFVINVDGTGLEALPTLEEGEGEYDPAWSPDGEKIAFTGYLTFNYRQIYTLSLETGEIERISDGDQLDFDPAWSADGERIAFISTRKGPSQVWVMFADGAFPQRFTASRDLVNTDPAWSPDGETILFTQRLDGLQTLIRTQYSEAGQPEEVKIYQNFAPLQEGSYSPDGRWYVFESWPTADTNHDIYLLPVEGGELQRVTTDPSYDFDPAWRP
ncbi:MAG: Protein TolB [Chloroflexi bacterium]|nr:Protein TolB [Chloroflexota bacterium]